MAGWDESDLVEAQLFPGVLGERQVAEVRRVEGAAEQAEPSHRGYERRSSRFRSRAARSAIGRPGYRDSMPLNCAIASARLP